MWSDLTSRLVEIFEDKKLMDKIKKRLPYLFQIANLESSRAGKIGMEVGSLRERILVALLLYKFGEENVETEIPITEPEVDIRLCGYPISIKTITGMGGVKIVWTVDAQKVREFREKYVPKCDWLFALINWEKNGKFSYIPNEVQHNVLTEIGRERYLKLPKLGTNPRGVEISKEALQMLVLHEDTKSIDIFWKRSEIRFNAYKRWVNYWKGEF